MKNSKRMCRQGWSILSAFFTKVIVLSLCLSLALGTTAFAGDDTVADTSPAAAASSETGGSGDSGSTDSNPADTGDSGDSNDTESHSDSTDGSDSNATEGDGPSDSEDKGDTPSNDVTGTEQGSDSVEQNTDEPADTDTTATEAPKADEQPADTTNEPKNEETDELADSETDELADSEQEENKQEQPAEEPAEEAKPETGREQEELPPVEVTEEQQEAVTDAIAMFAEQGTRQTEPKGVGTIKDLQDALRKEMPEGYSPENKYPVVIKITDDIEISDTLNIPDWMEVTLVLNGKTLSYNGDGTAMFDVAGGLSVFDELEGVSDERGESSSEGTTESGSVDTTEDASENTTGGSQSSTSSSNSSSSNNSGNSGNSSSSNSSSKSEHKNSSNVDTAKEEQTSENKPVEKSVTDNNTAEQKDALQETLKNWVNEDGSVKETKEVVNKVLTDVGVITTEKAVNVIFNVVAGGQLNLFGGIIKNGVGLDNVTGVKVEKGGTFEMSGGVIADMTNSGVIINGGNAEISGGAAIVNNSTKLNGGGISVKNGGTLTMDGGLIAGNEAIFNGNNKDHNGYVSWAPDNYKDIYGGASGNGGGVAVDESTFTMTGGKIHGNNADTGKGQYDRYGVNGLDGLGGGVYVVGENGSFSLSGKGVISNNEAGAGGGIFIHTRNKNGNANADGALFTMTGGEVSGNTALHGEGGGIFINSKFGDANKNNKITAGKITGNKTLTTKDLGGGGIYVNNEGTLNIQNAIVTANLAQGLGGGFAACVHGRTIVFTKNGAIFFDNKGFGNAFTEGHENEWNNFEGNGDKIDGNSLWKDNDEFKQLAQDIFAASDMGTDGNMGGILLGNETLFDGDASWEGYRFYYDENGEIVSDKVEYDEEGKVIYANRLLGLTSNPDDAAVLKALEVMNNALSGYLIISGNESSLHGGGIANNGVLTIGVEQKEFDETPDEVSDEFDMDKTLEKDEEAPEDTPDRELQDGEFEFVLKDESGKELDSVKNDADGKVNIKLPEFKEPGKYTFLVSEKDNGNAPNSETTVIYDGNVYVVVIEVTENITDEVVNVGGVEYIIKHSELTAGEMKFYKAELDENGNVKYDEEGKPIYNTKEELTGIAFNNKYTKPEEKPEKPEEKPEKPEEKPEEPETPDTPNRPNRPNTPDTPDVTVPDSPTPLAEMPEVEIPDEDVPLSEVSEEMEINDPEVPLGDVPRTGDAPVFPFAAAILGICGMLLAKLRKIS